ncbi:MAG: hypothetical protein ACYCT7_03685 [bacterium]
MGVQVPPFAPYSKQGFPATPFLSKNIFNPAVKNVLDISMLNNIGFPLSRE